MTRFPRKSERTPSPRRCRPAVESLEGRALLSFQAPISYPAGPVPDLITTGDFNADGVPDLAVTNNLPEGEVGLFLGNGNGTFQPRVAVPVGAHPRGVVAADFDLDGLADLATANFEDDTVSVLLGNGDGTFRRTDFYAGLTPLGLAAGDVNGDGLDDLVVANHWLNTVSVLRGAGGGAFQAPAVFRVDTPREPYPRAVTLRDLNNDGRLDVAVTKTASSNVGILLNASPGDGNVAFQPVTRYATGYFPYGVMADDFNQDSCADVVTADRGEESLSVLRGLCDGTFQRVGAISEPASPSHVAAADVNGDGLLDLLVTHEAFGPTPPANRVSLFFGEGNLRFRTPPEYAFMGADTLSFGIVAADFNLDGWVDVAVTDTWNYNLLVALNAGDWGGGAPAPGGGDTGVLPALLTRHESLQPTAPQAAVASLTAAHVAQVFTLIAEEGRMGIPLHTAPAIRTPRGEEAHLDVLAEGYEVILAAL